MSLDDSKDKSFLHNKARDRDVADDISESLTPEERLLVAVLDMAILDANRPIATISKNMSPEYKQVIEAQKQSRRSAVRWLNSKSIEKWSLHWICEILDIPRYKVLEKIIEKD